MGNKPLNILLIDDDEDYFIIIRDILSETEHQQFTVEWAATYDTGIETILLSRHDAYLIDYRLGKRDGLELLREAISQGCTAPLIMLTGQGDREIDIAAIKAGAADYLLKDEISSSLLERSLHHALERKRIEDALKESKEYAENLIHSSLDMIIAVDLDLKITEFNLSAQTLFGYTKEEVLNQPVEMLYNSPYQCKEIQNKTLHEKNFSGEVLNKKKNGDTFPVYTSASILYDTKNNISGIMTISRDITEQKRLEEKIVHDAMHDALTNLPNRALFINRIEFALQRKNRRKNLLFAMLSIDIDRFKLINNSLGHTIGDKLLVSISHRFKSIIRSCDTIARFGEDDFAILLEDIDNILNVKIIADRLLKILERPFTIDEQMVFVTASIGIALSTKNYEKTEHILRDADTVMYRAKSLGRNQYAIFDSEMHEKVVHLLHLEGDLRHAIEKEEFLVYYQPILSLQTGAITGVEALIRWQHPKRGLIPPLDFIPHAEKTGLIVPIGELVMKKACDQHTLWKNNGYPDLTVAVNFSPLQFQSPTLLKTMTDLIQKTNMDAKQFVVEITESTIMEKTDSSIATLNEMQKMGIQISIDDFGTGYSALSSLQLFPIHKIKIDRSLVKNITTDTGAATIAATIITMAHNLHLTVVAEGIETEEQLSLLRSYACDEMQGYLFSPPVPGEKITQLLQEKRCL